jgi:hypothetical protein
MANILRYTYQIIGEDSSPVDYTGVDNAKSKYTGFSDWDFTGLSPVWSLEDDNTTLVVTIPFPDTKDGRTAQDAFHNNVKDTWAVTGQNNPVEGSLNSEVRNPSNSFITTSIKDGEKDLI